jgi:alcohol dehydrogenase (cytochrome c)
MNFMKLVFLLAVSALFAAALPAAMLAQGASEQVLLHPPAESWPGYHGDYSGRRHSALAQITPLNVKNLVLAWAFQTEQTTQIKSSPLLVDGILYFTVPDNVWAIDARSGHQIWHYSYPRGSAEHIGHRGVAMYKGYLFFLTPDAHLVSLNAKDGTVRWKVEVADATKGYWTGMAPLVVGSHVLVGVSGDFDNLSG